MFFSPVQLGFDHDVFIHVGESKRERERERKRERNLTNNSKITITFM